MAPKHIERVIVDTTVETKAVAHPTDSHLFYRGIEWLNRVAKRGGIELRQSFLRLGKYAQREVGRLIHTGGHKQAMRHLRKLKTFLGRLHRDVGRKLQDRPLLREFSAQVMERIARLVAQKPDDKRKLYALHAPEVECIGPFGRLRVRGQGPHALGVRRQGELRRHQRADARRPASSRATVEGRARR